MKNFVQPGKVITAPAPTGGVVSGKPYLIGIMFGFATRSAAEGEDVEFSTEGVFSYTKETHATDQAWTVGAALYWDNANKRFTVTSAGNTLVGHAAEAVASTADTGAVKIIAH